MSEAAGLTEVYRHSLCETERTRSIDTETAFLISRITIINSSELPVPHANERVKKIPDWLDRRCAPFETAASRPPQSL